MLTQVSFCVFSPTTRWSWVPAMSRQHKTGYVIMESVFWLKRLLLRHRATVDYSCCRALNELHLLLCSGLKSCSPNWPERDMKAEFEGGKFGTPFWRKPSIRNCKRNQTPVDVILLIKNLIGFLKALRRIAERSTWSIHPVSTGLVFNY